MTSRGGGILFLFTPLIFGSQTSPKSQVEVYYLDINKA
jgi:hypothetical protein